MDPSSNMDALGEKMEETKAKIEKSMKAVSRLEEVLAETVSLGGLDEIRIIVGLIQSTQDEIWKQLKKFDEDMKLLKSESEGWVSKECSV